MRAIAGVGTLIADEPRFLVIDKAPGVGFHREADEEGLAARLCRALALPRLYPVHRLDRMTSGLLLFAKTLDAARALNRLFRERRVEKYYLALSDRKPKKKQGTLIGDMARGRRGNWLLLASRERPAVTQFFSVGLAPGLRLFLLRPHTGRTHQLRVAMKSLGAPILGDPRYQGARAAQWQRGYLHAFQLAFCLDGQAYRYRSPPHGGALFDGAPLCEALEAWSDPGALPWPRLPGSSA